MDSPWGIEFSIMKELGISRHEMLWKISWINLLIMRKDAPSVSYKKNNETSDTTPVYDSNDQLPAGLFEQF